MQELAADPTDADLAALLDADGHSISLRAEDAPDGLTVVPVGTPMWFVACCAAVPAVLFVGFLVRLAYDIGAGPLGFAALTAAGMVLASLAAFAGVEMIRWLDRKMLAPGAFFVLDRARRTLALPRRGVVLRAEQIRGFVTVRAWHIERDDEGTNSTWVAELSVLARGERGGLVRYPVVTCMRTGKVDGVAALLTAFFGVEHRALKLDRRTRRRLKAGVTTCCCRPGHSPAAGRPSSGGE